MSCADNDAGTLSCNSGNVINGKSNKKECPLKKIFKVSFSQFTVDAKQAVSLAYTAYLILAKIIREKLESMRNSPAIIGCGIKIGSPSTSIALS